MSENERQAWDVPVDHPGVESFTVYAPTMLDAKAKFQKRHPDLEAAGLPKEKDEEPYRHRNPPKAYGVGTGRGMDFSE